MDGQVLSTQIERGIPAAKDGVSPVLLEARRINVSHIFSQFVLEETQP